MKFTAPLFAILVAAALSNASGCPGTKQCQCLFSDGSHCCVFGSNAETGDTSDCTSVCRGASRILLSGESTPKKCNAGGKFSCASIITVQDRIPCLNS